MKKYSVETVEFIRLNYPPYGGKYCSQMTGLSLDQIRYIAHKIGAKVNFQKIDPVHYECVSSPEFAYILGYLWADGYVCKTNNSITLALKKEDGQYLIDIFARQGKFSVKEYLSQKKYKQIIFKVIDKGFHNFLTKMDYQNKSGASAKKILSHIPQSLHHYWWRGYSDGDGCFYYSRSKKNHAVYSYSIYSCYNQDWSFVSDILNKLDIFFSINKNTRTVGNSSHIRINRQAGIKKFGEYIYQGVEFGLQRKRNTWSIIAAHSRTRTLKNSSKYKHITYNKKQQKWSYDVIKNNQRLRGCYFKTEEEAYLALQERLDSLSV